MRGLLRTLKGVSWIPLLLYAATLLAALFVFAELAGDVYERERLAFDAPILTWFDAIRHPLLTAAARALSFLGSVFVLGPVAALLLAGLWRRSRRAASFFALGFGGAITLNLLAKAFFARVRPDLFEALSPASNYAFPSGHAMGSAAFFLCLYLVCRQLYPAYRLQAGIVGLVLTLGIGLSRPYLQVHYPSDIVAGWVLSTAWVLGVYIWYARLGRGGLQEPGSGGYA